jgi:hypothetical protein
MHFIISSFLDILLYYLFLNCYGITLFIKIVIFVLFCLNDILLYVVWRLDILLSTNQIQWPSWFHLIIFSQDAFFKIDLTGIKSSKLQIELCNTLVWYIMHILSKLDIMGLRKTNRRIVKPRCDRLTYLYLDFFNFQQFGYFCLFFLSGNVTVYPKNWK